VLRRILAAALPAAVLMLGAASAGAAGVWTRPTPHPSPTPSPSKTSRPTPQPSPATTKTAAVTVARQTKVSGRGPGGSMRATGDESVALTFDDGPDPVYTPRLLDLLKSQRVRATFCLVGFRAAKYPTLVRRIVAEGHTLCNHSWSHRWDLAKQSEVVILKDLRDTNDAIRRAVPTAKIKYFRAAGGLFNTRLVGLAKSLGMTSLHWSLNTGDSNRAAFGSGARMVNQIISSVKTKTRPGTVILAHDLGRPDTITAFRHVLPWLKAEYALVALPV
jgi:peptidoglycan-N-acetylglucosamine deacetylase